MIYTVLDVRTKVSVGSYQADYVTIKTPFTDVINQIHHAVEDGRYPDGYYIGAEGSVLYNIDFAPPSNSYATVKYSELEYKQEQVRECITEMAAENSELLNNEIIRLAGLGQIDPNDAVAVYTFVRTHLDPFVEALEPLVTDFNMHYYYRVDEIVDGIERDTLLRTEERLTEWKNKIKSIV